MPAQGVHAITYQFELELAKYTGAPLALAVDNCSNALWLCLRHQAMHVQIADLMTNKVLVPSHTYVSVPCEVRLAGWKVAFCKSPEMLSGAYQLNPLPVWDSALRFTADMYLPGQMMCLSFTGQWKHLKLGKGGAILLDDEKAYEWLKKARNSGRDECSYMKDTFTIVGRNCYMHPTVAALGIQLMAQFYNADGSKKHNEDLSLPYPDLSDPKHTAFR